MRWWHLGLLALAALAAGFALGTARPGLGLAWLTIEAALILLYAVFYFRRHSQRLAYAKGLRPRAELRLERFGSWLNFPGFVTLTVLLFFVFTVVCWLLFRTLPSLFLFAGAPDLLSALILTANAALKTQVFLDFFEAYVIEIPGGAVANGVVGSTIVFLYRLALNLTLIRGLLGWWDQRSLILDEIERLGLTPVADEAAATLGRLGPAALPYLKRARARLDRQPQLAPEQRLRRRMLCRALGLIGGEEARTLLLQDWQPDRPQDVRLAALSGLAALGDARDVGLLESARNAEERATRHAAYRGLLLHPNAAVAGHAVDEGVGALDAEVRDLVVEALAEAARGPAPAVDRLLQGRTEAHLAAQVQFLASLEKRDPTLADACAPRCPGVVQIQHFAKYFPTHLARHAAGAGAAWQKELAVGHGILLGQEALEFVGAAAAASVFCRGPKAPVPEELTRSVEEMLRGGITMGRWLGATRVVARTTGLEALEVGGNAEAKMEQYTGVCSRLVDLRNRLAHRPAGETPEGIWEAAEPLLVEFCQFRWLFQARSLVLFVPATLTQGAGGEEVRVLEYTGNVAQPRAHVIPCPGEGPLPGFALRLPSGRFLSLHPLVLPVLTSPGDFPSLAVFAGLRKGQAQYRSRERSYDVSLPRPTALFVEFAAMKDVAWIRDVTAEAAR
jgi:hypothetical protein